MKNNLFLILITFLPIFLFGNFQLSAEQKNDEVPFNNYLSLYGKHIYMRENCSTCHTFQMEKTGYVSLDGLGGKYPNSWIYKLLEDPTTVLTSSKMPHYSFLLNNEIEENDFKKVLKKERTNIKKGEYKSVWKGVILEMDSISKGLKQNGIKCNKETEAIALISFLQSIPSSKSKQKYDSIILDNSTTKEKQWNSIISDSNSVLYTASKLKNSIEKGKALFELNCSLCHGQFGEGRIGPNLTDNYWLNGGENHEIVRSIIFGIPSRGMKPWKDDFSPIEIGEILAFINSIKDTNPEFGKVKEGRKKE